MNLYEKVKQMADENNVSINKIELHCGFSHNSIGKWANSSPKCDNLAKIAKYFNVSTDYLLGNEVKENPISECEQELLNMFRKCGEDEKLITLGYIEAMANKSNNNVKEVLKKIM